jgi:hypothetical protein
MAGFRALAPGPEPEAGAVMVRPPEAGGHGPWTVGRIKPTGYQDWPVGPTGFAYAVLRHGPYTVVVGPGIGPTNA